MSESRALSATQDLAFEVKALGRHKAVLAGTEEAAKRRGRPLKWEPPPEGFSPGADWQSTLWEREKSLEWKDAGRLTQDGRLRVEVHWKPKPWTIEEVIASWNHLNVFDRLAVLLELDGQVKEGYMERDAQQNIREVVQRISRDEAQAYLSTPEGQAAIAEVVHTQIATVFGGLLDKLRTPGSALARTGRQNRCGNCGTPGHRVKTCKLSKSDGAAMREAAQAAKEAAEKGS